MLDRSPRRSVATFSDFVGGDSVNIAVLPNEKCALDFTYYIPTS